MVLHQTILVEIDDNVGWRRAMLSVPTHVLPLVDQRHHESASTRETGASKQYPEACIECRLLCLGKKVAAGDSHG